MLEPPTTTVLDKPNTIIDVGCKEKEKERMKERKTEITKQPD